MPRPSAGHRLKVGARYPTTSAPIDFLENLLAQPQIVAKRLRVQQMQPPVVPAMARDLVAGVVNGSDQPRVLLRNATDNKKRRPNLPLMEEFEEPLGRDFHALVVMLE